MGLVWYGLLRNLTRQSGCKDQEQLKVMFPEEELDPDEIKSTDFDFQISEGQLMAFEGSLDFVMKHCNEDELCGRYWI
jgi:hypothetical protein